jgi:hypothetical protein
MQSMVEGACGAGGSKPPAASRRSASPPLRRGGSAPPLYARPTFQSCSIGTPFLVGSKVRVFFIE